MGKAARLRRERAAAPVASRSLRLREPAVVLGLAVVLAASTIAFIESARPAPPPPSLSHGGDAVSVYTGISQHGRTLGRASSPVTMIVYLDPQCPYCGEWERAAMPELVTRYVRNGTLRIVVRGLHFVGPDSERALRLLDAAALQDRFFQAAALLYWNQGRENSGWVTDGYLRSLAHSIPGADSGRLLSDLGSPAVARATHADQQAAVDDGVASTPWVELGRTGGNLGHVELSRLDASAVAPAIARLAAEGLR